MLQAADLTIRLHPLDDVVIARVEIPTGTLLAKEKVAAKGFVYRDTPGYDPVSATGQVAGGANMICFTTGRGSAYGCKPAPSLKLATNTPLFVHQEEDMDFNCGTIIDGSETIQDAGERFFQLVLQTASGRRTKSEEFGYGDDEFAPWTIGATM